ncbi:hypothetical protein VTI28DRAFT_9008 [Corynascus sepedonium]
MSEARQRVIETNRSLRLIKNELESLLEKGVISDSAFDSIHALLPAESPLSGPGARSNNPTPAPSVGGLPTPAASSTAASSPAATTPAAAPPSYAQSTASPPSLPARNNQAAAPPPPPPQKPVLVHARALYRYAAGDARDLSFERDDRVAVHEYMNADWWMGRNLRTGQEGIFPRSYVVVEEEQQKAAYQQPQYAASQAPAAHGYNGGGGYPVSPVPVHGGYTGAAQGQGAYGHQQQPPPQHQEGGEGSGNKIGEHGKKFGKKLGNAAIFGAGATIGSNIVNSIF